MKSRHAWGELTSPEVNALDRDTTVLLLPFGAIEQHGPHLPIDTDTHLARSFAAGVADGLENARILPEVAYGYSNYHRSFPGTITIDHEVLFRLLMQIALSVRTAGFTKLVLLVGHAGNQPIASLVTRSLAADHGFNILCINCLDYCLPAFASNRKSEMGGEFHAGELETALELHLRPELVEMGNAVPATISAARDFGLDDALSDIAVPGRVQVGYDLPEKFPSGVMGDPSSATAATGRICFDTGVREMAIAIDQFRIGAQHPRQG